MYHQAAPVQPVALPLRYRYVIVTLPLHCDHTQAAPVQRGLSIGPERTGANFVIKVDYCLTLPYLSLA